MCRRAAARTTNRCGGSMRLRHSDAVGARHVDQQMMLAVVCRRVPRDQTNAQCCFAAELLQLAAVENPAMPAGARGLPDQRCRSQRRSASALTAPEMNRASL